MGYPPAQGVALVVDRRDDDRAGPVLPALAGAGRLLVTPQIGVGDDEAINRHIFTEQLTSEGAVVAQAGSGREALAMIESALQARRPFDLVLLDQMMPELSGDDVAACIRAEASWKQPGLVLASSLGILPAGDRKAAFDAVLTKPVRHAELLDCLARVLQGAPDPGTPSHPSGALDSPSRAGLILLADDHEINRFVAARILDSAGYSVEVARNGAEAVSLAREDRFDLILMDVQMPVMDGLEASRAVRALGDSVRQPRIVALTADVMANNRADCYAAGMDDFIEKPFDPERFLDTVGRNLAARAPKVVEE